MSDADPNSQVADGSNYRDGEDGSAAVEADGTNYRNDSQDQSGDTDGAEVADGTNYRRGPDLPLEADGSNYRQAAVEEKRGD
jgi:hypothetical protein